MDEQIVKSIADVEVKLKMIAENKKKLKSDKHRFLLTVDEVADYLRVDARTVYRYLQSPVKDSEGRIIAPNLKSAKIGGKRRIDAVDLVIWIEKCKEAEF